VVSNLNATIHIDIELSELLGSPTASSAFLLPDAELAKWLHLSCPS